MYYQSEKAKKIENDLFKMLTQMVFDFFINNYSKFGFEERIGQQDMALDIADCIKDQEHILVEAGVGIGKSYAYIVPLIYYHQLFGKPIAIATSTITLQEQLKNDIDHISHLLNYPIEIVLAKGQTHFVCRQRADIYFTENKVKEYTEVQALLKSGSFDRKDFPVSSYLWNAINVKEFQYKTCQLCQYHFTCGFFNIRGKMQQTNGIILCNQDLLTMHLRKRNNGQRLLLNSRISIIVIDEAHNLEDKVRNSLTTTYSKSEIIRIAWDVNKAIRSSGINIDKEILILQECLNLLFNLLNKQIQNQIATASYDMKYAERFFFEFTLPTKETILKTAEITSKINDLIGLYYNDQKFGAFENAVEKFEEVAYFFKNLAYIPDNGLYWLEKDNKGQASIFMCPKKMDKSIRELYFESDIQTILASATIANQQTGTENDKYGYFIRSTGFPVGKGQGYLSEPKPSPFPYNEHAMIYYSSDLPHPTKNRELFIEQGVNRIVELLQITHGKALILFTAKTDLEEVYLRLKEKNLQYTLLTQRSDASQEQTLSNFRLNVDSVLLGTGAYWEGINIEGKSLSNLIIFRLPFPVPDPIIEYKRSISKKPLMDVDVPEMIIKLKQGIGRLIRSSSDKGIVSILDPRLGDTSSAPYKDIVWGSLPITNKTDSLEELKTFYTSL